MRLRASFVLFLCVLTIVKQGYAIQCYQCDSDFDANCKADKPFDRKINALVDCLSDEAYVPGVYCVKTEQRSPGWWGWHKVTRRCGSSTGLGSANTCAFGQQDKGVFVIECNCNTEGCNSSTQLTVSLYTVTLGVAVILFRFLA